MEIIENIIIISLFTGINIGLARYDAWKIKRNMRIRHAVNSILYCLLVAPFYSHLSLFGLAGLFILRIPVFNTFLNVFRGHPATHISHTTTSIIDKTTNKVVKKTGYWVYHSVLYILAVLFIFI